MIFDYILKFFVDYDVNYLLNLLSMQMIDLSK